MSMNMNVDIEKINKCISKISNKIIDNLNNNDLTPFIYDLVSKKIIDFDDNIIDIELYTDILCNNILDINKIEKQISTSSLKAKIEKQIQIKNLDPILFDFNELKQKYDEKKSTFRSIYCLTLSKFYIINNLNFCGDSEAKDKEKNKKKEIVKHLTNIINDYTPETEKSEGMINLNNMYKKSNYLGYYDLVPIENIDLFNEENVKNSINLIKNNYLKIFSKNNKNSF